MISQALQAEDRRSRFLLHLIFKFVALTEKMIPRTLLQSRYFQITQYGSSETFFE